MTPNKLNPSRRANGGGARMLRPDGIGTEEYTPTPHRPQPARAFVLRTICDKSGKFICISRVGVADA